MPFMSPCVYQSQCLINRVVVDWKSSPPDKFTSPVCRLQCATSTANGRKAEEVRNCLTDEGRPLGVGLQEQAPNHLRRLWPKATVVNAEGKGSDVTGSGDRQEEDRKGTTAEVSKVFRRWPKPQLVVTAGPTPTIPAYGRSGVRHERWPELAMRRLNGTWEPLRHERENNRV